MKSRPAAYYERALQHHVRGLQPCPLGGSRDSRSAVVSDRASCEESLKGQGSNPGERSFGREISLGL